MNRPFASKQLHVCDGDPSIKRKWHAYLESRKGRELNSD
jgi:hypothetical protein